MMERYENSTNTIKVRMDFRVEAFTESFNVENNEELKTIR